MKMNENLKAIFRSNCQVGMHLMSPMFYQESFQLTPILATVIRANNTTNSV
jgi:hypothetical protein